MNYRVYIDNVYIGKYSTLRKVAEVLNIGYTTVLIIKNEVKIAYDNKFRIDRC
jgi:hypothetical protein